MSRTISLAALAIVAVLISSDRTLRAAAPTTQPDLAPQNAALKKVIADTEARFQKVLGQLHDAELQNLKLSVRIRELQLEKELANLHQATPNQPYRAMPMTNASPYLPDANATLGSFKYNGKTVYLVGPNIGKPLSVAAHGPDRPYQGNILVPTPVAASPVQH